MPFKEIHHTADWSIRVWAVDLPSLFIEAARGMNSLSGLELAPDSSRERIFEFTAPDYEIQLVAFLSELVYEAEQEKIGYNEFEILFSGQQLNVKMKGAPVLSAQKTIKAVTYHNLKILQTRKGYVVDIVFDV